MSDEAKNMMPKVLMGVLSLIFSVLLMVSGTLFSNMYNSIERLSTKVDLMTVKVSENYMPRAEIYRTIMELEAKHKLMLEAECSKARRDEREARQ